MIFKNFADQDWIGLNFIRSGLDSDWKISQSAHLCPLVLHWMRGSSPRTECAVVLNGLKIFAILIQSNISVR